MWGFDVSHLTSHLGALQPRPEFFDAYLELAVDFGLPAAARAATTPSASPASRSVASPPTRASCSPTTWSCARPAPDAGSSALLFELEPGVTELASAPGDRHRRAARRVQRRLVGPGRGPRAAEPRPVVPRPGGTLRRHRRRLARAPRPAARQLNRACCVRRASRPRRARRARGPRSPAVFIRPCMKAALAVSSPSATASAIADGSVSVRSGDAGAPGPTSATTPSSTRTCHEPSPSGRPVTTTCTAPEPPGARPRPTHPSSQLLVHALAHLAPPVVTSPRRSAPQPGEQVVLGVVGARHRQARTSDRASTYSSHGKVSAAARRARASSGSRDRSACGARAARAAGRRGSRPRRRAWSAARSAIGRPPAASICAMRSA